MSDRGRCDSQALEAPEKAAAWYLTGHLGAGGELSQIPISNSPFLIGRSADLSLCLPFPTVSSVHAEIRLEGRKLTLRDRNSTNGTFVNGRRVAATVELHCDDLIQFAGIPWRLCRATSRGQAQTLAANVCDEALALVQFEQLMTERSVTPYYQPIVEIARGEIIGYEALGRSSMFGLRSPAAMFGAAAKLNHEASLSRMLREEAIEQSREFATPPHLFLNTHPTELADPDLAKSLQALRELHPSQPLTLEIHEAAVTEERFMSELRAALNDLDISLAYDDFGAGRSRLSELVRVPPDFLKFDISLIRRIHATGAQHQQMIASLVKMVRDLGIVSLTEGVETAEESATCRQLGFELAQGFFHGKPAPAPSR